MNVLDLFTGYAGFQLGLRLAGAVVGFAPRTVCYVERETYPIANLVAKIKEKALDNAPIWSDVTTFNAARIRGKVDCVTGGFPCQPFSLAGKQQGLSDERWLWGEVIRIAIECESPLIFVENVPNIVNHGLPTILQDLAKAGYDAEWDCFSASEIGATHRRERFFLLAHSAQNTGWRSTGIVNIQETYSESSTDVRKESTSTTVSRCNQPFPPTPDGDWSEVTIDLKPAIYRMADGNTDWMDELALCGNGVVPGVVAFAFIKLAERLGIL